MKTFLAVYLGSADASMVQVWDAMDEAERSRREAAGMQAWGDWMETHADAILDGGGPLGKTKQISPQGIADTVNRLTGYIILKAESHEAAAAMFRDHPHFTIFPGESVEVMECLPIPGS